MKKALLASAAVMALLAVPAQAADMPLKAPPLPALTTSWAGFYVGAHVGYGYANTAVSIPELATSRFIGMGSKGWVAGGLAGYNVMLSPRWVGGIEVDGSWQDIKTKTNIFGPGNNTLLAMDWSASVRARIGYLMTPTTMLFVTGGWSWSNLKLVEVFNTSVPKSINGPQVGFGTETMVTESWIFRTEYLHAFYNDVGGNAGFFGADTLRVSPWVGVIRSALIYKAVPSTPTPWPDRQPMPSWTGIYIGGLVGPLMSSAKITEPVSTGYVDGLGVSTILPAAVIGFNLMVAPRWVVGIEGEAAPNISTSDVKIEWTGSARVRAGYLVTPLVLAYGTVGWATAGIKNFTLNGTSSSIAIERSHGLLLGTGLEAAVSDRWRLRADFQSYWSNTITVQIPNEPSVTAKSTAQTARLGLIYQMGGP